MLRFLLFSNEVTRLFLALQKTSFSPIGMVLIFLSITGLAVLASGRCLSKMSHPLGYAASVLTGAK